MNRNILNPEKRIYSSNIVTPLERSALIMSKIDEMVINEDNRVIRNVTGKEKGSNWGYDEDVGVSEFREGKLQRHRYYGRADSGMGKFGVSVGDRQRDEGMSKVSRI
jgi:hypothetical protein